MLEADLIHYDQFRDTITQTQSDGGSGMRVAILALLAPLLAACAGIRPAGVTEILVASNDFTLKLPPFVTVTVSKTTRAQVIGLVDKDGMTYRAIELSGVPEATALRFLIRNDGTLEGSAVDSAGSSMGFTYLPVPAETRFVKPKTEQLYTQVPEPLPPVAESFPATLEQIDAAYDAVDRMLAATLKDPISAIQYRVSAPISCRTMLFLDSNESGCICYEVNAKNSYGGYTGSKLAVAELVGSGSKYVALAVDEVQHTQAGIKSCLASQFQNRSADRIKEKVE